MSNFETSGLALSAAYPSNVMITDEAGMPSFYYRIGQQKLSALITGGDSTVHPAFRVSGVEQPTVFIGKFQGVEDGSRIYSLPGVDPKVNITLDQYESRCRSKGKGHHCITAAEWAFLALWCKKNNCMPKGNNNYGKDESEMDYLAIPVPGVQDQSKTARVLTGTGPVSWRHNGQLDGICDLNGNVWEWTAGLRLVKGELQVIPYNNAADNDVDTGESSTQWKAVDANAASWEALFIAPNGSGTTANSVKLDWDNDHWKWATSITGATGNHNAAFGTTKADVTIKETAKRYLQAMALLPEDDGDAAAYGGDWFWANNKENERCAIRGGNWSDGARSGVFALSFYRPRSDSSWSLGGRPAFVELETD